MTIQHDPRRAARFGLTQFALTLGLLFCAAAVSTAADPATILDDPAQLDESAAALQKESNTLCWELHRHHQQQPDFKETYRQAKDLWGLAGAYRDALRAGDAAALTDQVARMNDLLARVQAATANWGDGLIPATAPETPEPRMVVVPGSGVNFDIPFFGGGVHVGRSPRVVMPDPNPQPMARRRPHPNAHGSKRALDRELAKTQLALQFLSEDTGMAPPGNAPPGIAPSAEEPRPAPPSPGLAEPAGGPALSPPLKISPPPKK